MRTKELFVFAARAKIIITIIKIDMILERHFIEYDNKPCPLLSPNPK